MLRLEHSKPVKTISTIVLAFFLWSFGGVFDIAYAINSEQRLAGSVQGNKKAKEQGPSEKFEEALEKIREAEERTHKKIQKGEDTETEEKEIKSQKTEIEKHDIEIKKQFKETEDKIKSLPEEIKQRHRDFVKKYEENLNILKTNLDDIEKAKTKEQKHLAHKKTKEFLEKTKPPKKHKPLDPNKLPHRTAEPVWKEPRLDYSERVSVVSGQWKTKGQKPILVGSAGSLDGLLDADSKYFPNTVIPWLDQGIQGSGYPIEAFGYDKLNKSSSDSTLNATPSEIHAASYPLYAQANIPTDADLAETDEVKFTPELRAIAALLENNPVLLYEFMRNNFVYEPYYGSVKGSQSTLLLQSGNDFDQASLLIALLRVSNIPARYAYGTIDVPIEKVQSWVGGVTNPATALNLLATAGIPVSGITSGGKIVTARIEHVWVEAYLSYANYRGIINDPNAPKTWIPLDPSFKLYDPNPNAVDLAEKQGFNIDSYFESYLQFVKPKTPAKDYLITTVNYVAANLPGQNFFDLLVSNSIMDKILDLLPDTLPYRVLITGEKFSVIPDKYRHRITVTLTDTYSYENILSYTASWAALLHKRFTLSYIPASTSDEQTIAGYGGIYSTPSYLIKVKPVLKVEGITVAAGSAVNMAGDIICQMSFIGPQGKLDNLITNTLTVGATQAIGLGSGYTTGRIITYRTAKLEAAVTAGESGEPIIGEYLNLLALNYLQELDSSRKLISKTMKILDTTRVSELMVGVDLGISYLYGVPTNVTINGVFIDADYILSAPFDMNGDQTKVRRFTILSGMNSSALEHTVFESIVGVEAVSAIKALQVASTQGIPIHKIDASNIATKIPLLQLTGDVKNDIRNSVNAGRVVIVSEREIQLNSWRGVGYIVLDSQTGAGAYMISGGLSGGSLTAMTSVLKYLIMTGHMTLTDAVKIIKAHKTLLYFPQPVDGPVTSDFNDPRPYGNHGAVDFAVINWTPVAVIADGTVKTAEYADAYNSDTGFYIEVDHGAGVVTRYLHNCQLNFDEGQKVSEGDIIALSGNTGHIESRRIKGDPSEYIRCQGNSHYGSHVHFELRLGGTPIDPKDYGKWE